MPNHCSNRLTITGPAERLKEFAAHASSKRTPGVDKEELKALDFNEFFPMPEEMRNLHSGGTTINGKKYDLWREEKKPDGTVVSVGIEPWQKKDWIKRYGAAGWYDWACLHWGTKWGAYDISVKKTKGSLVYRFSTAWSPPADELMAKMGEKFPDLKMVFEFAERGSGFAGRRVFEDGDCTDSFDKELGEGDFGGEDEDFAYKHDDEFKDLVESSG